MRQALRYGATWVSGGFSVNELVPWSVEPERTHNAGNREKLTELVDYAHSLHLKFIVYEDEFSFHPTSVRRIWSNTESGRSFILGCGSGKI